MSKKKKSRHKEANVNVLNHSHNAIGSTRWLGLKIETFSSHIISYLVNKTNHNLFFHVQGIMAEMNSSAPSHSWSTSPECEIYHFIGGKIDQPTTEVYVAFVFVIVMSIITCPFTEVLNALVMIAVKIKRRLRTKSNIAIACLAATDGLMGLVGQPIFIAVTVSLLKGETSNETCTLQQLSRISVRLLAVASLFHLVLMNVERYMAIKRPFGVRNYGMLNIPLIAAGDEIYLPVNDTIIF